MRPGVDPKVDFAFKRLFGSEETMELLIHLLNAVLRPPPGHEVASVELLNPFNEKDTDEAKLSVLDVKARDAEGKLFNVEMQMAARPSYPQRVLYYWAKVYGGQLVEGEDFDQLRRTISISFLDNQRFPHRTEYHHVFHLRDRTGEVVLSDDLEIHFVELPKFRLAAEELTNPFEMWCYFLRHGADLDTETLPATMNVPPVRRALEVLNVMTQSDWEREVYEGRLKARRDASESQRFFDQATDRGKLIGEIQGYQKVLDEPLTAEGELLFKPLEELARLAQEWFARVKSRS